MTTLTRFAWLLPLGLLASCGLFSGGGAPEEPVDKSHSYLQGEGPQAEVDLGQGGERLLTRFQNVLDEKLKLQEKQSELLEEIDGLRTSLQAEKGEREKEHRMRVGAEADADRLRKRKGDLETKILHLQMQIAELERTKLQLEIAEIERQIELFEEEGVVHSPIHAAAPGSGR